MILVFGISVSIIVLFNPSPKEFIVFWIVDYIAVFPMAILDTKFNLFLRIYPSAKPYFPQDDDTYLSQLTLDQKKEIFRSLSRFPLVRSLYLFIGTFVKIIPACLVIVFYWETTSPPFFQVVKFYGIELLTLTYFFSAAYASQHDFISHKIREFHKKYNWEDLFFNTTIKTPKNEFLNQENLGLISMMGWSVFLFTITFFDPLNTEPSVLYLRLLTVLITSIILVTRIYFLHRKHFIDALKNIFTIFDEIEYNKNFGTLPLHTTSLLSRFDKTFNDLIRRLKNYEEELSSWVISETEESRFRSLGQISGLVIHDLNTPLHVIQFCVDELQENPEKIRNPKFLNQLDTNIKRSSELVTSLRAFLRNPELNEKSTIILEAQGYVTNLLKTQFKVPDGCYIVLDPELQNVCISFPRITFINILYNLFKNSLENIIKNDVKNPAIFLRLDGLDNNFCKLIIEDNGTGLSLKDFEAMTSFRFHTQGESRKGLGLRLTRRLIEYHKGEIQLVPQEQEGIGTKFLLTLPLSH